MYRRRRVGCEALMVAWFILLQLSISASPIAITEGVRQLALSPDGSQVAFVLHNALWVMPRTGGEAQRLTSGIIQDPCWSPDGKRIVFAMKEDENTDLWQVTAGTKRLDRLTSGSVNEMMPSVSPDGRWLAYVSDRNGNPDLWLMDNKGEQKHALTKNLLPDLEPHWDAKGRFIVYTTSQNQGDQIATIRVDGEKAELLAGLRGRSPQWSADGRYLAFVSRGLSIYDVKQKAEKKIIAGEVTGYSWVPESNAIVYAQDGSIWEVAITPETTEPKKVRFECLLEPEELFEQIWSDLNKRYYSGRSGESAWSVMKTEYAEKMHDVSTEAEFEEQIYTMLLHLPQINATVSGKNGVVAASNSYAAEAGIEILKKGGNVVDAAVASAFVSDVVEVASCGVGGEGMMLIYRSEMAEPVVVDFRSQAPIHATWDNPALKSDHGRWKGHGPQSALIPGEVRGLYLAFTRFGSGKVAWHELLARAIQYADEGFPLDEHTAFALERMGGSLASDPEAKKILLRNGRLLRAGEVFRNPDLASALRCIATYGDEAFYKGTIAEKIDADMRANGGLIFKEDLAQYRAIVRKPVVGEYRDVTIYGSAPPCAGGVGVIAALQILNHYAFGPGPYTSDPRSFFYVYEAIKVGYDVALRIGDPAFWNLETSHYLSKTFARTQFERIRAQEAGPAAATPEVTPEQGHTSHLTVADSEGNMVALTHTLSGWFGSCHMVKGTGIIMNNELRNFRQEQGEINSLLPLARVRTDLAPLIAFRKTPEGVKEPYFTIGVAGGDFIPSTAVEIVVNVIDHGKSLQQAIEAPRFLPAVWDHSSCAIEDFFFPRVLEAMRAQGKIFSRPAGPGELRFACVQGAMIDAEPGIVTGAADPRGSSNSAGYVVAY
jgi:gamma-glutamyltranspeptidase/glutathione hydrolase